MRREIAVWLLLAATMATMASGFSRMGFRTQSPFPALSRRSDPRRHSSPDDDGQDEEHEAIGPNPGHLSTRGSSIVPLRIDMDMFQAGMDDAYHPETNPNGYLVMVVAENKLMLPEINAKLQAIQENTTKLPDWTFGYGDFGGDMELRKVFAANVMERFCGGARVNPDCLRLQAGAGSVLNLLSLILGDPNDGVLAAGPLYPAFPADFDVIGGMKLHVCGTTSESRYVPSTAQLEASYESMARAGNPPKIFLLCQPHNPTGVVYTYEDMSEMIDWALAKDLHVVSDEIYALSVFPGVRFVGAAQIMKDRLSGSNRNENEKYLGDRVHIVYGLSKDWGMSGFRVGTLFSHNEPLLAAFDQLGYYQCVSQHTQYAMTQLFSDTQWIEWFISENRKRLHANYKALEQALDPICVTIPVPAQGSHFAWADFSSFLSDAVTEEDLWLELFREAKVLLTTGESCFEDKPGMFRIVHPWPEGGTDAMHELGRRLIKWKASRDETKNTDEEQLPVQKGQIHEREN